MDNTNSCQRTEFFRASLEAGATVVLFQIRTEATEREEGTHLRSIW